MIVTLPNSKRKNINLSVNKGSQNRSRITIITVVYNGAPFLEEAIQSIIAQNYSNLEYIVIDGGSDDGSVNIIKKYREHIDYWVSEPDGGIYDAMNKGIAQSNGEIIGILNSDDILIEGALEKIFQAFLQKPEVDYVYGSVQRIKKTGDEYARIEPIKKEEFVAKKYQQIPFPHPSLYVKKQVFDQIGVYNTSYTLNADYDFILRLLDADLKGIELEFPVAKYRDGGRSAGIKTFTERRILWKSHGVPLITREWNAFRSVSKVLLHSLLPDSFLKLIKK